MALAVGAVPNSHLETLPWPTPTADAKSATFILKTCSRIYWSGVTSGFDRRGDRVGTVSSAVSIVQGFHAQTELSASGICVPLTHFRIRKWSGNPPSDIRAPMNIFDKLEKILKQPDWSQVRLAKQMAVAQSSVNRWSQRQSEPRGHYRDMIAEIYEGIFGDPGNSGVQEVPLLAWISAGAMTQDEVSQEAIGTVTITDLPEGDWIALRVKGTSMDRISPPDSLIFVNRADRQLVNNACYVIGDGEGNATYKRYRPNPVRFEPVSTDPNHEALYPDNDPTIIGRVVLTQLRL